MTLKELLRNYAPDENQEIIVYYLNSKFEKQIVYRAITDNESKWYSKLLENEYKYNDVLFFYNRARELFINITL